MLQLGTEAPWFELPDPRSGRRVSIDQLDKGNGLLVMFLCNHCPFVRHIRQELAHFAREYDGRARYRGDRRQ
jgi:thiol-disulfide isomerase/thioredoxin